AEQCTVQDAGMRLGLGFIKDIAGSEVKLLVCERERAGPFRSLGDLAARSGVRRLTLEQLAWSGACDELIAGPVRSDPRSVAANDRRTALWRLGLATPAEPLAPAGEATQLALPLKLPPAPSLRPLGRWQ